MPEAPPVEEPIVFPVMSWVRIRSHLWNLTVYGMGLYLGITGMRHQLSAHESAVLDFFILIFSVLMFFLTALIWLRDQGSQIIIQGNRIELRSASGDVRSAGLISNILDLKATQSRTRGRPWTYVIVFSNRHRIVFDRNIPNLPTLVSLVEQRSGLQFDVHQS
jgi:hypothetical protein